MAEAVKESEETLPVPLAEAPLDAAAMPEKETIPLSESSQLLRKLSYGASVLGFLFHGLSGISNKNPLRTAAGLGRVGVNVISVGVSEENKPLPDKPIPLQMADSMLHPQNNALFFNKSWAVVCNVLTVMSGVRSSSNKEALRGAWQIATGGIEISGLSDQDRREKRAEAYLHGEDVPPEDERTFGEEILSNRWISLGSSAVRAGLVMAEGLERKHGKLDKNMLLNGICYAVSTVSLLADNYLVEEQIKETDRAKKKATDAKKKEKKLHGWQLKEQDRDQEEQELQAR